MNISITLLRHVELRVFVTWHVLDYLVSGTLQSSTFQPERGFEVLTRVFCPKRVIRSSRLWLPKNNVLPEKGAVWSLVVIMTRFIFVSKRRYPLITGKTVGIVVKSEHWSDLHPAGAVLCLIVFWVVRTFYLSFLYFKTSVSDCLS